ncbi:hypothetical protein AB0K92_27450 [Streptomyces sp. NPDC052687]|uniref:hypothetical protein n=1 Tax=Streptomyces sp. NPDC052687 TaxID=3154759 RepID=UPI0034496DFE
MRAQRGLGADAVDALSQFYELKAYKDAEPDSFSLAMARELRCEQNGGLAAKPVLDPA